MLNLLFIKMHQAHWTILADPCQPSGYEVAADDLAKLRLGMHQYIHARMLDHAPKKLPDMP